MTDLEKKEMKDLLYGTIAEALEEKVFPKFERIDEQFDKIDEKFSKIDRRFDNLEHRFNTIEEKVDNLTQAVEIIDSDMGGVKMRLAVVEKKLDGLIDTSLIVRNHEKRISTLKKATI